MAIIKCKMCGGDLRLEEGSTVCECEYCGTRQTVPSADNEKKLTLFSRAGRLLRGCEFDKAAGVFETIVADFPEEAEAYWGLVLCKYGIEYVDDPATGKKTPTCHRSSFDSVLDDPNYEQACENTDAIARRVYRDEARQIEELRKQIIEVSGKEEPYDIFISYKETDEHGDRTLDSVIAQDIYTELTEKGFRVFFSRISLEDKLGTEYEPYIFAALNSAKVMLVVGTDYENFDSVWVKNEWSRFLKLIASGQKKTLIPVFKNMDAYDMPKEFAKLAAQDIGKVGAMQDLVRGVEKLISKKSEPDAHQPQQVVVQQSGGPNVTALLERGKQALEDAEFEKARGFYDQVLNMDAKNADAFWGLFLAANSCVNEDAYIAKACSKIGTAETLNIATDQVRINEAVKINSLEHYLDASEIQRLFVYDTSYPSTVSSQQKIALDEKRNFESDRNLARAFRFGSGETVARLNSFKDKLYAGLDKTVENAKAQADSDRKEKQHNYEAFLADAEEKAIVLRSDADAKKEVDYQNLVAEIEKTTYAGRLISLRDSFMEFGDYKDAQAMAQRCDEKIAEIEKLEAEKAEKSRLQREKGQRIKKTKKTIVAVCTCAIVAAVCFAFAMYIIPSFKLDKAKRLIKEGNYEEAYLLLDNLDYKDSSEIQKHIEAQYQKALLTKQKKRLAEYLSRLNVGQYIQFGSYEQDNNLENGEERIDWKILKKSNNKILVISKYALEFKSFNSKSKDSPWKSSSLREWLNGTFRTTAFNEVEQAMIPTVSISIDKSTMFGPKSDGNVQDQIFLLSESEAKQYFSTDRDRKCTPTKHANEDKSDKSCEWWLRSASLDEGRAAIVLDNGAVNTFGYTLGTSCAVRPAMWIDLTQ